jgi:shikimate kinase
MKKIILLGYMGCGKSTIAKDCRKPKVPFVDLDTYIEKSGIIDKCYFKMKRNQIQEDGA